MTPTARSALLALLLAATAAGASPGPTDDVVLRWNRTTLDVIRARRIPPPRASRLLAIVHLAMHDAANGARGRYEPYAVDAPRPHGAPMDAAASAAAHAVLAAMFPSDAGTFDAQLDASLEGRGARSRDRGVAFGRQAAGAVLARRAGDGADVPATYTPATGPGFWQPTPPAFAPALLPGWPQVTPFALARGDELRAAALPDLASAAYRAVFDEVKRLGGADSTDRTPDQTEIALFWNDGAGTATPPGHWNEIAASMPQVGRLTLVQRIRLFALLNLAMADAAICAWDTKYAYDHWRPVTAIRAADDDGNPDTAADPAWSSLIPTPPFPAYVSGHSTFSSTAATVLARLLHADAIPFDARSEGVPGVTRHFPGLWAAALEAGESRIYGGIHWRYDNTEGLSAGSRLGALAIERTLRRR